MAILRDVPLRSVPVAEPETALDEVLRLMEDDPLKTVVLVGDGMFMGIFDQEALDSGGIPRDANPALLSAGPYARRPQAIADWNRTVEYALDEMKRERQDVLPVVQNVRYLGVVTREDLANFPAPEA